MKNFSLKSFSPTGLSAALREATERLQATLGEAPKRPSLGAALKALRWGRQQQPVELEPRLRQRGAPNLPLGARFEARNYSCVAGARNYKLYVPAGLARPQGLVLMLHGCRQDPDDFAAGATMNGVAEEAGFLVAWPEQSASANPQRCWNWFSPAHQKRGAGEPAILAGIAQSLAAEFQLPPRQVFVAGLSAGGAMALVMARCYPEIFAAAGVHSGLPYRSAHNVVSALAAMRGEAPDGGLAVAAPEPGQRRQRIIVFHGDNDHTVAPANAERIMAEAGGNEITLHPEVVGGRNVRHGSLKDANGAPRLEIWRIAGAGHAWSGGSTEGSFADAAGPNAAAEMMRFFRAPAKTTIMNRLGVA